MLRRDAERLFIHEFDDALMRAGTPRTTGSNTARSGHTKPSRGTGQPRCTSACPTPPSRHSKPRNFCQLLDAGHPQHHLPAQLRPRRWRSGGVLPPHTPAAAALVPAHPHVQDGGLHYQLRMLLIDGGLDHPRLHQEEPRSAQRSPVHHRHPGGTGGRFGGKGSPACGRFAPGGQPGGGLKRYLRYRFHMYLDSDASRIPNKDSKSPQG